LFKMLKGNLMIAGRISVVRWKYILIAALLCLAVALPLHAEEAEDEVKIGNNAATQVDKESKFITDPVLVQRVQAIGKAVADVANTKEVPAAYGSSKVAKFNYSFKILDDKEINAFSLPGGHVYINKGLLDYVQSDDELAGVMAHEVAHAAHHHAMHLIKTQQQQMLGVGVAVLASILAGAKGGDMAGIAYMANLINIAKMSDYGKEAEFDADRTAVAFMAGTKYNPVGMLTFMERLARDEIRKPEVNYGIFANHPPSRLRASAILKEVKALGLPINRRLVTKYVKVEVKSVKLESGESLSEVWVGDTKIVRLADIGKTKSLDRADELADRLGDLLDAGAGMKDVRMGPGGTSVILMGTTFYTPTADDAALAGQCISKLADSVAKALQMVFHKEKIQSL
jgi:Zn-dependent protease with chaperone function